MNRKKKSESVTRGYRLKPGTHRLIKQVKKSLGFSHDKIINEALKLYCLKLKEFVK